MVSHDLLKRFSAGFQRFQKTWYCPENNIYEDLRVGQHPYALVIACSDSRVDPVLLLDATPGDLFVIRNVASISASARAISASSAAVNPIRVRPLSKFLFPRPRRLHHLVGVDP